MGVPWALTVGGVSGFGLLMGPNSSYLGKAAINGETGTGERIG